MILKVGAVRREGKRLSSWALANGAEMGVVRMSLHGFGIPINDYTFQVQL